MRQGVGTTPGVTAPRSTRSISRVWIDFTHTSWNAEATLGYTMTRRETDRQYRLWNYIGRLLGIAPELAGDVRTHDVAAEADRLFDAVTGPLTDQSTALAHATIDSVADQLHKQLRVPEPVARRVLQQLTHRFHGHAKASALAVPRARFAAPVVGAATRIIRVRRRRLRSDPQGWTGMKAGNVN